MVKRVGSYSNRAAKYARMAGTFARAGYRAGQWVRSRFRGNGSGTARDSAGRARATYGNLTFQHDTSRLYRKKRAPGRVRRRMKRYMKKFTWAMDKFNGMKVAKIFNSTAHTATPTNVLDAQTVFGITIYGYGSNDFTTNNNHGNGDMWYVFSRENGGNPSATAATRKLRFRSAVMNINIVNIMDTEDPDAHGGAVIIDVYHVICKQSCSDSGTGLGDPAVLWSDCVNELNGSNIVTPITVPQTEGVTPFDAGAFARYMTIKNVRRYRLNAGGFFNLQLRDPGNYVLNQEELLDFRFKRGVTEGYLFVAYNPAVGVAGIRGACRVQMNYNKTYHYAESQFAQSQAGMSN